MCLEHFFAVYGNTSITVSTKEIVIDEETGLVMDNCPVRYNVCIMMNDGRYVKAERSTEQVHAILALMCTFKPKDRLESIYYLIRDILR